MEFRDVSNDRIQEGFYLETFYKGKDESRNRIVYIAFSKDGQNAFSLFNKANLVKLNPAYSSWLKPFEQEILDLDGRLEQIAHYNHIGSNTLEPLGEGVFLGTVRGL